MDDIEQYRLEQDRAYVLRMYPKAIVSQKYYTYWSISNVGQPYIYGETELEVWTIAAKRIRVSDITLSIHSYPYPYTE